MHYHGAAEHAEYISLWDAVNCTRLWCTCPSDGLELREEAGENTCNLDRVESKSEELWMLVNILG